MEEFLYLIKNQKWNALMIISRMHVCQILLILLACVKYYNLFMIFSRDTFHAFDEWFFCSVDELMYLGSFLDWFPCWALLLFSTVMVNWTRDVADSEEIWAGYETNEQKLMNEIDLETKLLLV
jgi:hypothetical protein